MHDRRSQERYRDARTGEYVSRRFAERHPNITVKETDIERKKAEDRRDEYVPDPPTLKED